ncbi:MAG: response regulator [Bacteroidales bacterium]|nr:response regulator [Bacteroidales bacterium]MCF8457653.1 response regulator [Bacteroidales bacterium]
MKNKLRILILEDCEPDLDLMLIQIRKENYSFVHKWVQTEAEYRQELQEFEPDIILSDYQMPSFTGLDALYIAQDNFPDIPFIIVTGSINEETAVNCMKQGAWDYVLKERIVRLGQAIKNVIKLRDEKIKKRTAQTDLIKSERLYRLLAENSSDMIAKHNLEGVFEFVSPSSYNLLGYESEDLIGRNIYDFFHPDDLDSIKNIHSQIIDKPGPIITEYRLKNAEGKFIWMEVSSSAFINDEDEFSGEMLSITRNIQERKEEEAMREAVYNIGQAVVKSYSQKDLFAEIHKELQKIFFDSNFYLAIYTPDKQSVEFPSGNMQPPLNNPVSCQNCVMDYIVREDISDIFSQSKLKELVKKGEIKGYDPKCLACMAVPLHSEGKILGGLVVQNPNRADAYTKRDLKLLEFIATQIGLSIQGTINEEKLIMAKNKAEESDLLKSAFLANMSHEIRTPMNAILGFADLLGGYPELDEDQKEYVTRIKDGGNLLIKLINDIIDLSKIEAGQLDIDIHTFSANKLLEDLRISFEEVKKTMGKKDLHIVMAPSEQDYFIQSDSFRLRQILSNFISNALKYTHKGVINMGVKKTGKNTIRFYVKDTGIGIAADKIKSVFERFNKIDQDNKLVSSGTGLGLAISKSLAEYLEGTIYVESEPGKGSEFSIELPFIQSLSPGQFQTEEEQLLLSDFKNKTILIVEDDEASYFYLASALKKTGASIIWAMDGDHAIEICKKNLDLDIVLMDIRLPKLSGYVATHTIKNMRPNLPIVAQTAYAMSGEKQKCFDAGCDDYLAKPIKPNELLNLLAKYIGKVKEGDS